MNVQFSIFDIITLLGGIQGILLSGILFFSGKENKIPNRFLAFVVFTMGFTLLDEFSGDNNIYNIYDFPFSIPYLYLGIGPAIYFYAKYLINPNYRFSQKNILHFIPLFIQCTYYLTTEFWTSERTLRYVDYWYIDPIESYSGMVSILIYSVITLKLFTKYKSSLASLKMESNPFYKQFILLKWLLYSFFIIVSLWFSIYLYTDIVYKYGEKEDTFLDTEMYFPVLFGLTIVIYTLGFSGYYKRDEKIQFIKKNITTKQDSNPPSNDILEKTSLVRDIMEEKKLYLDPELSLKSFADQLEINPKYLSQILNSGLNKKFNDFVNEYRVEEVKKRLVNPEFKNLTIIGIALDSGFNSKAAFNRVFKNHTNMSPKEYKDQHSILIEKP